ncbi:MAG TPA: tail fiber domain-containing protein, partial [Candidatus Binatia bacterium]|nr:tail fiber domain-containing protein [Candidatus Binatia bacterium]
DPALCAAPACASAESSCCDACRGGDCPVPTTTTIPPRSCATDADCDDGNPCSRERCVTGRCESECLCVGPAGTFTCCPGPAGECGGTRWFTTCGDPVCGGHRDQGVKPCAAGQTAGATCDEDGATCDPLSDCNELLLCTTSDPTHGGLCPISRRRFKEDVHYLDAAEIRRLHDTLMRFPLASYRYRGGEPRPHLGFVIEDVEPSPSVDAARDMVDLYGYTTMAVAALQAQSREIAALRHEVRALRRALRREARD